ncbi:MAG: DUF3667 domain-containing protein [Pseudomonadota bacterium]|jgi:hypothetical protein|uniref:DUF3667 domain-containing protein n=1 Tax=hydrothermal vent metagenome TaxID=652676 RepID=A0A161K0Q0_9ZZZZ
MNGGIEAAGDIATGALIGRAIEPRAGDSHAGAGHGAGGLCLNCGTALVGDHCHACGQAAHVHRSLAAIGHDLLHGVFHFEGKVWRTLPMLVLHPGALTRRYIAGERARFVSPLALFLFSVFLMFASIHTFDGEIATPGNISAQTQQEQLAEIDARLAKAQAKLEKAQARHRESDIPDARLIAAQATVASLTGVRQDIAQNKGNPLALNPDVKIAWGWLALEHGINKAKANPGLALYKLQSSAYKYSWALIPISVPFVALLFLWRRGFKLYDHAIFVTYSLSFMTLLVVALTLAWTIGVPTSLISMTAMLAPPVHMFAQLRGAYSLRKRSALWRTMALMVFALLAFLAFTTMLLILGLMK